LSSERQSSPVAPALAPLWHTAALVALYLLVGVVGTLVTARHGSVALAPPASRLGAVYAPLVVVQVALALYVVRVGRPKSAFTDLLGHRWTDVRRACVDVALALATFVALRLFDLAWARVFVVDRSAVLAELPVTGLERAEWAVVAVTVGVSEELVFRGYLQTQLGALTGRAALGVVLQAALFGIAHAEQGGEAVARVALYGAGLGVLARLRRSLLPGMICHVATDLVSGLVRSR